MRFGLTARLLVIGASALLAVWITVIASFYWTNDLPRIATRPPPEQLKAIVDLVSSIAPAERQRAVQALQSSILEVRLVSNAGVPTKRDDLTESPEFAIYHQFLGDKLLHIWVRAGENDVRVPQHWVGTARPLDFWLALDNGGVLVAEARTPFIVTLFGLPAGMGAGLLGTLFACIAFYMLHREIKPLTKLATAVDRIDPSGEPVSLPWIRATTPEIAALVRAFHRMQTRLYAMTRSRMALIGGIQHDVRSFATRLRLRLEQLPDHEERERATADIADMIDLLDNALLTSRAGVGALNEELLDIAELLCAEITDFRSSGLPVVLETDIVQSEVWVIGDRLALRRIIGNIVDNAVKYGRWAHVALVVEGNTASILVEDEGPGFAREETELLLEPFVRAEPSRARRTGGAGLGLAVARALVEAHGGTISLANGRWGGSVSVALPLYISD
ncbi:sensor histidine kinase [Sinorhizobium meliloti]|uniref:sensor histidine kinase n=1 Tax=Rhizobium meliloti TaxID=382 RepID=UPI002090E0E0|nr:ATP-binding protein [Sinorhizobium meliloti]MCO5965071.1 ATP-binding protein [Sinorhizobium meliloti]